MNATNDNGWEEVQDAAAQMFSVWVDGTELEWAKEAWNHLHAAGLASGETILEVTERAFDIVKHEVPRPGEAFEYLSDCFFSLCSSNRILFSLFK